MMRSRALGLALAASLTILAVWFFVVLILVTPADGISVALGVSLGLNVFLAVLLLAWRTQGD